MIHLVFRVPGPAVGKAERVQIRYKLNKNGKRKPYPHFHPVDTTETFMATVAAQAQLAVLESKLGALLPTDDALAIEIVAFFPRPKSAPKSQKWPIAKPDSTNIQKAVEDALHGIIFTNDSHTVDIHTSKRYCVNDMEPQTRVEIWTAGAKVGPRWEGR